LARNGVDGSPALNGDEPEEDDEGNEAEGTAKKAWVMAVCPGYPQQVPRPGPLAKPDENNTREHQ
jgi:hypothetical protein